MERLQHIKELLDQQQKIGLELTALWVPSVGIGGVTTRRSASLTRPCKSRRPSAALRADMDWHKACCSPGVGVKARQGCLGGEAVPALIPVEIASALPALASTCASATVFASGTACKGRNNRKS